MPSSLRLARTYVLRYRWRYLAGFAAVLCASFVVMVPPVILARAIDELRSGLAGGEGVSRWDLALYGLLIVALACIEGFMRFAGRLLVSGTSRRVEYEIRNDLAAHFMKMDQAFFLRSQTGDLMARCTNDLQLVRDLLGPSFIDLLRTLSMLVVGFVFLISVNLKLGLIAFAYFPIVALLIGSCSAVVERKYREVQDQFGVLSTRVQENISGMRTIKAYAQEETETAGFAVANKEMLRRSMSWAYWTAAMWPLMVVATGASTVLVLWFGGRDVANGGMTLGEFVQFNAYLIILANPLMSFGWTATAVQQGVASLKRIGEVFDSRPTIVDGPAGPGAAAPHGDVSLRGVSFGYNGHPMLKDISLEVPSGTMVAIVGATGSGKTTLVNLLARIWDPQAGSVSFDGTDIRELPLASVREAVGFVPQETFLFSESLRDNIAYGRAEPTAELMEHALTTSQLGNDLAQLTHGLDTVIGERGVTLSGGQKQRAALARAIIKDPAVLVLDDALSHVDTHTEEEILHRLRHFAAQRTTFVVAHRTSTIAMADVIVVLEGGRIVEQGTHEALLAGGGAYARFYRRQLLAEQVEEIGVTGGAGT
ncbi:MAG: ABC transporter ATP-binding protein [Dehalococcoidia bacterium]